MSISCVLHPRLSNGEKSPLFSRLKNFLGDRKSAEDVYYKAINPAFREAFPNVRFDHNGEPLLEDLITQCGIGYNKDSESMLDFLNSEYGTKPVPKTIQSVIELQNRAASFNINSSLNKRYSAQLTSSGQDVQMEIVEATGEERSLGKQQRFNAELNNQLVKLLNSWGADVAALTELEEASNVNGVMDLSAGINAATGLKEVIRISKRHKWSNTPAKQNILSEEEQRILKSAPRNSKGQLLAPNGKVSNLTEKQYAQVRTKAFKEWFGDWENDLANASKVVDENGEPRIVYRGINDANKNKLFAYFSNSKTDARAYAEGLLTKGGQFYANNKNIIFAINKVLSEKYKLPYLNLDYVDTILDDYSHDGEEYEVNDYEEYEEENEFLPFNEIKKRLIGTHKEIYKSKFSKEEAQAAEKTIDIVKNNKEVQELLEIINLINNTIFLNESDILRQADDTDYIKDEKKLNILLNKYNDIIDSYISEYKPNIQGAFLNIKNPYINEIGQEDLLDNYKAYRNGHDGAFLLSGMHFLVKTKGNQIKSATDNIGAFSRTDDNIYHANTNLITNTEIYANPIANGATDNAYGVRLVNDMDSFVRSFPEQYRGDIEHLMARDEIKYSCM